MTPEFAVVGHPNKGKSSIVATLARDDRVAISPQSGITRLAETFRVQVGKAEFRLVDTPGFQRPTQVLQWLQKQAVSASQRAAAVLKFIADEQCLRRFPDEVELLRPIANGAAILYVVDGSRPYGAEYEAEMEILRWTGQASMALINPIESDRHVDAWQNALKQYFKVVKVFNAHQADFERQLAILETFSHLKEEWQAQIRFLIAEYRHERERQVFAGAALLAELLRDLCSFQISQRVAGRDQARALRSELEERFFFSLKRREEEAFANLQQLYHYRQLDSDYGALSIPANLFATEKWVAWGLNKQQLTTAAALGGAAGGALLDVGLAGHSLMLGALGGGLAGGLGVWLGADHIAAFRVKGSALGGYEARQGPVANKNFPYVVLGRFLSLVQALRQRNHARRDVLALKEGQLAQTLEALTPSQRKRLHAAMYRLSRQKEVENLEKILMPLFAEPQG